MARDGLKWARMPSDVMQQEEVGSAVQTEIESIL